MDYLNLEEELVDYAEVSGFDLATGSYLKNVDLLRNEVLEEKNTFDIFDMVKSVFVKKETVV